MQGVSGEFSARQRDAAQDQAGDHHGEAQTHPLTVGDRDMARTMGRVADGHDAETSPEQRMGRVGYLDLFGLARRVLEGGVMLVSRSDVRDIASSCCNS